MQQSINKYLPILIFAVTLANAQYWCIGFPQVINTAIGWTINFGVIFITLQYMRLSRSENFLENKDRTLEKIFGLWLLIGIVRGVGECFNLNNNYWIWKNFITTTQILCVPFLVYLFANPEITRNVLGKWFKWAFVLSILVFPFLYLGAYHFVYSYVFLVGCFLPLLPKKYRIWIVLILGLMFVHLSSRSQVIKAAFTIVLLIGYLNRSKIPLEIFKISHWLLYIIPVILLFLGLTGRFNIFETTYDDYGGKRTETIIRDGEEVEEDLAVDTRTFIYEEVISSAIEHNYLLWGRTPARGNDSAFFGAFNAEELKTGLYERQRNELCHLNILTWLGLIGMIIWGAFYLRASWLAIYRSNSIFIKILGIGVAFHWAFGWIEDISGFDTLNIYLWMSIAMCLSKKFRAMNDAEFRVWLQSIFKVRQRRRSPMSKFKYAS